MYGWTMGLLITASALAVILGLRPEPGAGEAQNPASVAVARRGAEAPFARGVLVDFDLVLTVRHATHIHRGGNARYAPDALEIRLDVDGSERIFPVTSFAYTSRRLDFALLRIGTDASGEPPPRQCIQRLSEARVPLDAMLTSRDPAATVRVLFPFEATDAEVVAIRDRYQRHRASLDASYVDAGTNRNRLYAWRWARHPTIGVECHAPAGSSGAPLFNASGHVVGLLFAGDTPTGGPSGWLHHDALLPVAAICAELEAHQLL